MNPDNYHEQSGVMDCITAGGATRRMVLSISIQPQQLSMALMVTAKAPTEQECFPTDRNEDELHFLDGEWHPRAGQLGER